MLLGSDKMESRSAVDQGNHITGNSSSSIFRWTLDSTSLLFSRKHVHFPVFFGQHLVTFCVRGSPCLVSLFCRETASTWIHRTKPISSRTRHIPATSPHGYRNRRNIFTELKRRVIIFDGSRRYAFDLRSTGQRQKHRGTERTLILLL